jgi:lipopolysaccharide heptosyltransferase II
MRQIAFSLRNVFKMIDQKASIQSKFNDLQVDWEKVNHILAIRLDNIGDLVMLGPALRAIKTNLPQAKITVMASPAGSEAVPLLPWVDEVFPWRAIWQDISGRNFDPEDELRFIHDLKRRNFDAAFIFTSFSQSPYPPAYVCFLAGIPYRFGQAADFGGSLLTHRVQPAIASGHQVDRNLHLLEEIGLPSTGNALELKIPEQVQSRSDELLREHRVDSHAPYIVLVPGASAATRRYDPHRYASVMRSLAIKTNLPIVVLGSSREQDRFQPVLNACKEGLAISLVGKTSVPEMAALIKGSSLVMANNSSAMHIADAFRRPAVILFSGTEFLSQWEPRNSPAVLLRRGTSCSPCYKFDCPYHLECLDIPVEEVVDTALTLISEHLLEDEHEKQW